MLAGDGVHQGLDALRLGDVHRVGRGAGAEGADLGGALFGQGEVEVGDHQFGTGLGQAAGNAEADATAAAGDQGDPAG